MGGAGLTELQQAYVPLGTFADKAWQALGAGVLIVDLPVAWLVTAASLLDRAGDRALAAHVWSGDTVTIVDMAQVQSESGLSWLRHESLDLAAALFPLQAGWDLKGFGEPQLARTELLRPGVQVCSLGCPPSSAPGQPPPIVLDGILSDVQVGTGVLLTSAPLLGLSVGAPLLQTGGLSGQAQLAGILTRTILLPEHDPRLPPIRLAEAVPVRKALALIRSPAGKAQRKAAIPQEGAA
jgi:hypothetical protein